MFYSTVSAAARCTNLKRKQSVPPPPAGEHSLTSDLQYLATLAAARALEFGRGGEGVEDCRHSPIRRRLNLRRKCSWTPRHEPVRFHRMAVFRVYACNHK